MSDVAELTRELTDEQKNTLRAALRAHENKIEDAIAGARRRKDTEHAKMLLAEHSNLKALFNNLLSGRS